MSASFPPASAGMTFHDRRSPSPDGRAPPYVHHDRHDPRSAYERSPRPSFSHANGHGPERRRSRSPLPAYGGSRRSPSPALRSSVGGHRGYRSAAPARSRHATQEVQPTNVLGVFGLSIRTGEEDLKEEFSKFGHVEKVVIVFDQRSQRSRGFGFVTMRDVEDATTCIRELNGFDLHGRPIRVDYSVTTKPHQPTPGQYMGIRREEEERGYDRYGGGYSSHGHGHYGGGGHYGSGYGSRRDDLRRDDYRRDDGYHSHRGGGYPSAPRYSDRRSPPRRLRHDGLSPRRRRSMSRSRSPAPMSRRRPTPPSRAHDYDVVGHSALPPPPPPLEPAKW